MVGVSHFACIQKWGLMNAKKKKINHLFLFSSCPICRFDIKNSKITKNNHNIYYNINFKDHIINICKCIYKFYISLYNKIQGINYMYYYYCYYCYL